MIKCHFKYVFFLFHYFQKYLFLNKYSQIFKNYYIIYILKKKIQYNNSYIRYSKLLIYLIIYLYNNIIKI